MNLRVDYGNGNKIAFIVDNVVYLQEIDALAAVKIATEWSDRLCKVWLNQQRCLSYFKAIEALTDVKLTLAQAVSALNNGGVITPITDGTSVAPEFQWTGTSLSYKTSAGTWSEGVDLKGDTGADGVPGAPGSVPEHQWVNTTKLQFKNPDGEWDTAVELKGATGTKGDTGPAPEHTWDGTSLKFKTPAGTWGDAVNLKGEKGEQGTAGKNGTDGAKGADGAPGTNGVDGAKGDTGPMPDHEWQGTKLRFKKPDGSWGDYVDLVGPAASSGDAN